MTLAYRKRVELSENLVALRSSSRDLGASSTAYLDKLFRLSNDIFRRSDSEVVGFVESLPQLLSSADIPDKRNAELAEENLAKFLELFRNRWCFDPTLKDLIDELGDAFWDVAELAVVGSPTLKEAYRGIDLTKDLLHKRVVLRDDVEPLFEIYTWFVDSDFFNTEEDDEAVAIRVILEQLEVAFIKSQAGLM